MDSFAERLRERAEQLGMTHTAVAKKAGLEVRRLGNYMAGNRRPNFEALLRICKALDTTPNQLLGVEDEKAGKDDASKKTREALKNRLLSVCDALSTDDLRMLVQQVDVLGKFRVK